MFSELLQNAKLVHSLKEIKKSALELHVQMSKEISVSYALVSIWLVNQTHPNSVRDYFNIFRQ